MFGRSDPVVPLDGVGDAGRTSRHPRGPVDKSWLILRAYAQRDPITGSALDCQAICHRTREADELKLGSASYRLNLRDGPTVKDLEHTIRQTSFLEDLLNVFCTGGCLR